MSDAVIEVRDVWKEYRLGELGAGSFKESFQSWWQRRRGRAPTPHAAQAAGSIWALRAVSLDVRRGEILGIVGGNGAGKSTLLKILSRITAPTRGSVHMRGRVASLLEVGTGFHPELSGRENIFLNGAILGMTRPEIRRKFDEIVDFAGVEKFLDTPVKRYSSGMYVRLAFAVAAHLETEILFVDEVLAVGDAEFQKRCLGKMRHAAHSGRTLIFVSHNMPAVQTLCHRAIWLEAGMLRQEGAAGVVVHDYQAEYTHDLSSGHWPDLATAPGNDIMRIRNVEVRADPSAVRPNAAGPGLITVHTPLVMEFQFWNLKPGAQINISAHVYNSDGVRVFVACPHFEPLWEQGGFPVGLFRSLCSVPGDLLNNGSYRVQILGVEDQSTIMFEIDCACTFDVADERPPDSRWFGTLTGVARPALRWRTEPVSELAEPVMRAVTRGSRNETASVHHVLATQPGLDEVPSHGTKSANG